MAEWLEPIFDRTQADVDFALGEIAKWKRNDVSVSDVYELKGCLNVSDINRIEGNIQYLAETLRKYYYFPTTTSKTWSMDGLPNTTDVSRIIGNIRKIISAYYADATAPALPNTILTYEQVNAIEKNLYLIKAMINDMAISFRECGTFNCGEG
jgi:hypothetical protein